MLPGLSQAHGSQLFYYKGQQMIPMNRTFFGNTADTATLSIAESDRTGFTVNSDFFRSWFGGKSTFYPDAYANHRALAIKNGKVYMGMTNAGHNDDFFAVGRFDGSGLFINKGDSAYEASPGKNGRGFQFLSPSGTQADVEISDYVVLNNNQKIHFVVSTQETDFEKFRTQAGWTGADGGSAINRKSRTYKLLTIDDEDNKVLHEAKRFSPDANQVSHTNMCDAIFFGGDLIVASWIDILRFNDGEGLPNLIHSELSQPSAKSFAIYPSGGLNSDGSANGELRLLMLDGSGTLRRVKHSASGVEKLADLGPIDLVGGRTTDAFGRLLTTGEPGRTPLLIPFNNELHAFISTPTSGYRYFTSTGSPSGANRWTERTRSLPIAVRNYDGNIFGYSDAFKNELIIKHITMGDVGMFGQQGINRPGGAETIYRFNANRIWTKVYEGIPGLPSRSFIPYQNYGPEAIVPSGAITPSGSNPVVHKCNDYAILEYKLRDQFGRSVNVDIDYSINKGVTWTSARRFRSYDTGTPLGEGKTNLAASPEGTTHEFYWDYVNDLGFNTVEETFLRIRPRINR